ncbi:tyrosine-type recombinase/integrase [Brevibacillus panacihumi]|uniref:tyrosine-type recombinase/integrase n=1 Tax=Brevibacillus panacihumi TaxID=497735 RepID=UPI003D21CE54
MLLTEAISEFKTYQIGMERSFNTIDAYQNDLIHLNKHLLERDNCPVYVEDISTEDLEDYLYFLKDKLGYQAASRKRKLGTIRAFFKFCYKKRFCEENVAAELETIRSEQKERTYLTDQEVQQIINVIEHPLIRLVIQTLYYTGLRISECTKLTLSDVDLAKEVILVREGKGRKDRLIPINQKLRVLLLDYKENWRPRRGTDNFFCTPYSGRLSPVYVNRVLSEAVDKLGWSQNITAHTFRHSFASNLVKQQVNIVQVQKLLGHTSLVTTSIYTHTNMTELSEAVNTL